MHRNRPTVVLVMAIITIVFGGLGSLCGVCGLGFNSLYLTSSKGGTSPFAGVADIGDFIESRLPGYKAIEIGNAGLVLFFGIVLIAAGIGLLNMQSWRGGLASCMGSWPSCKTLATRFSRWALCCPLHRNG